LVITKERSGFDAMASAFQQKLVAGLSLGISLPKINLGMRLSINHLSLTLQKWELYVLDKIFLNRGAWLPI
jgi:hypothetical protein